MTVGDELVATYHFGKQKIYVYGCWDKDSTVHYDFYDIYDENGECLNLGEPFYKLPTRKEVKMASEGIAITA